MPGPPLGIRLVGLAKVVSRAFDDALAEAGGSRPVWLVLMAVRGYPGASQQQLAERIGIKGATLTHHMSAMEKRGLVIRSREPGDRRNQTVRLRPEGERVFQRLRAAAEDFDSRLRDGLRDDDVAAVQSVLARLEHNLTKDSASTPRAVAPPSPAEGET